MEYPVLMVILSFVAGYLVRKALINSNTIAEGVIEHLCKEGFLKHEKRGQDYHILKWDEEIEEEDDHDNTR